MSARKLHRNFGVYGICVQENKLLVVNKTRGPYRGRYDLPGGNVENDESMVEALHRELLEEAGVTVDILRQVGVAEYIVPFPLPARGTTHIHHIAVYYEVQFIQGNFRSNEDLAENDAAGAVWIDFEQLTPDCSSPLVIEALAWLQCGKQPLPFQVRDLDDWVVRA